VRQVGRYWIDPEEGFWFLLKFGMQMTVILVTGYALATTPILRRMIGALAILPRGPGSAAALVALMAMLAAFVHWGLGLMVGALLARAVGGRARERGIPVHYPLLGAAGYVGLMVWHGGWSGSAPLIFATDQLGMLGGGKVLPFSQTLFSPMNLTVALLLLLTVPALCALLAPRDRSRMEACPLPPEAESAAEPPRRPEAPADRLDRCRLAAWGIGLAGLAAVLDYALGAERADQIAVINGIFLFSGLILHGTPRAYLRAVTEGTRGAAGIILQFPFYAGIMGMMSGSGLAALFSEACASLSTPASFPGVAFLSAAVVNVFVPSGGGQVAVQGQILIDAARSLGVPAWKTVMALAYGDQITNMLQPFWALALLGITGLEARQIMGYTLVVMIFSSVIFLVPLTLF
jgi:short-chain fatty acids transporter